MLKFIKSLLTCFKPPEAVWKPDRPKPAWPEIVDLMYDKSLSSFGDDVIQVGYSADKEKRFIILKSESGFYEYSVEQLVEFDDEEWLYVSRDPDALPGMWVGLGNTSGRSIFGTAQEAWNDLLSSPEYKSYFADRDSIFMTTALLRPIM